LIKLVSPSSFVSSIHPEAMHLSQSRDEPPLWVNQNPTDCYMWKFLQIINRKYNQNLGSYDELYAWSIDCLPQFWEEVWAFTGVQAVSRRSKNGVELTNGSHSDDKP
jgi:acetoacetyl-CoA synthetase